MGGGDQALWGVGRLGPSLAASPAWVGDKLWSLLINAASATPVTGTEGGKGVREVGGWEESRENGGTEGQGASGCRE